MLAIVLMVLTNSMHVRAEEDDAKHYLKNVKIEFYCTLKGEETMEVYEEEGISPKNFSIQEEYMYIVYEVQEGDTLSEIAEFFGISMKTMKKNNPQIEHVDKIWPSDRIILQKKRSEIFCIEKGGEFF